ncbi:MAG: type II toxin-antitoxin system HicA family toxin [Gammaproteobacteria bacterium]|nr:type II toxin-antitoxin system HicA family toxin [Gammaproteobacteria bacterium]
MLATLYRDVTRALKTHGWEFYRQGKGSHEIWRRIDDPSSPAISVPSNISKPYTAESIMKQAGLPKDAYLRSKGDLQ